MTQKTYRVVRKAWRPSKQGNKFNWEQAENQKSKMADKVKENGTKIQKKPGK